MNRVATIILNRNLPEITDKLHDHVQNFDGSKTDIFVIEGNYLFIQSEPWVSAAKNFQYSIFVDLPDKILRERLFTRHQKGGFSMDLIKEKIENVDIPNAALIRETKSLANVIYIEDSNH